jgi:hypothetical protein
MTPSHPTRSLRRTYLEWVDDQIEEFKDQVPRSELLHIAERVVEELRVNHDGQYQITELLLCEAVDRTIFRMLKLPSYRSWRTTYRPAAAAAAEESELDAIPLPMAASV